jgi:hypothetical protein
MAGEMLKIRVIVPDTWTEKKVELPTDTAVGAIKEQFLAELLGASDVDPGDYYVEYFEKEVLDESTTLADLGVAENGVISLRPYDMDHPPPFKG